MANQNWKVITKTCVSCGSRFECKSTNRRTQWCDTCNQARKEHRSDGHNISNKMGKSAIKEGKRCEECGEIGHEYHHIKRLADGGSKTSENLIFLCRTCHSKKHFKGIGYILRFFGR